MRERKREEVMRSDSSDRWQDDVGEMRQIKLKGNMKERCNAERYGKSWMIHCLFILHAEKKTTCLHKDFKRDFSNCAHMCQDTKVCIQSDVNINFSHVQTMCSEIHIICIIILYSVSTIVIFDFP